MKRTLFIFFVIFSSKIFACSCLTPLTHDRYNEAEFVATIKIIDISFDSIKPNYRNFKFKIIDHYKGEKLNSIKIYNLTNSMCNFYMPKNTRWLIYGTRDKNGVLSLGYCSGSIKLDRKFESKIAQDNYNNDLKWTFVSLQRWKENNMKADYLGKKRNE